MMWFVIFLVMTMALLLLPLAPGMLELALSTDIQPLNVIQEYDTDITHFARNFKTWLEKNFTGFFATNDKPLPAVQYGILQDHTPFQITGNGNLAFSPEELASGATQKLILSAAPLQLAGKIFFESEIYSAGGISTGASSQFRAMLAEGDIELGKECTTLRWVHSQGTLSAAEGSHLYGRVSAGKGIKLAGACLFERLNAPQIVFGSTPVHGASAKRPLIPVETLPNIQDRHAKRWRVEGDLYFPAYGSFEGDLIATRCITIGSGSHIKGSLKSNHDLHLAANVRIDGAVVSAGSIHMEPGCRVAGPVIAENGIRLERGAVIGAEGLPTTITGRTMQIAQGVVVFGSVWAEENATVEQAA